MTTKTITPAKAHDHAKQQVAEWTAELAKAREELETADRSTPADAAAAKKQATAIATSREFVTRCEHALEAAIDRQQAAARAVVDAEADALEPELKRLRAELAEHDQVTENLLKPLREHTGRDWAAVDPVQACRDAGSIGRVTIPATARDRMTSALRMAESRQQALRAAALGEEPANFCRPEYLPESLLPGGVLPSPTLVARKARTDQIAAEQAEHEAQLAEAQQVLDTALRELGSTVTCEADAVVGPWSAGRGRQWRERWAATLTDRQIWADVDEHTRRGDALETVAALSGWDDASKVAAALHTPVVA